MKTVPLLALLVLLCTAAHAERLLLDAARWPRFWTANTGAEFPGADIRMNTLDDPQRGACLQAVCQFTGESRYAGLQWRGRVDQGQALGFWVWLSAGNDGSVRLLDSSGQWFAGGFKAQGGAWSLAQVPLTAAAFSHHWGGANDGQFHFPLTAVLVAVGRGPDQKEFRLSNLHVERDAIAPEERLQIVVSPGGASGILFQGDAAAPTVRFANRIEQTLAFEARMTAQTVNGNTVEGMLPLTLQPWEEKEVPAWVTLDATAPGYTQLEVAAALPNARPVRALSGLAAVPRPRHYGQAAPDCYFGIQVGADLEAAERLGAKTLRHFLFWRYSEGKQGRLGWSATDQAVEGATQHHMDVLLSIVLTAPGWIGWNLDGKPRAHDLPDPTRLGEWERFVGQVAERYGNRVRVIEIENEPDLTCVSHPELTLNDGVDYYLKLLRSGAAAIRKAASGVPVAGTGVSGGDMDRDFPFTKAVLDGAAECIDLYAGHPYASPRNFGPGQHPKWPVPNRMAEKCRTALDLMTAHNRPRRMWVGELGWPLDVRCDPLSPEGLDWSACILQSMLVGKTVPGVEKYMHFTLGGCNESGYEYGLLRGDPAYPLPAAAAYAAAAHTLDDTRPIELAPCGDALWRASFVCNTRQELVIAWWADTANCAVQLAADAPAGRWSDSFFATLQPEKGRIPIGRLPVYWVLPLAQTGEKPAFLDAMHQTASVPVQATNAFLKSVDTIVLELVNYTDQPRAVRVEGASAVAQDLSLAPGGKPMRVEVKLTTPVAVGQASEVRLTVTDSEVKQSVALSPELLPLNPPAPEFSVDGNLTEWQAAAPLTVANRVQVLPPDGTVGWSGPDDLSLRVWLAADARGLIFACAVTDDIHAAPLTGPGNFWKSDGIQIAIDPDNDSLDRFDDDDREVGLVLSDKGPRVYLDSPPPARALDVPVAIRRDATTTTYEALLTWDALGIPVPVPGRVIALNFIANDDDGAGRAYWMGLTPGIGEAKNPQAYRKFVIRTP
ncbi:MAG: hypothetical protein A3K19_14880 [Lentisphaerae bacterium RIFOXYB12_FULL_65_16]|nr:MAG: hypothetical protein A3K18_27440 [Lentisphaerae bacterium RIFOXYA12_64_32]OGV85908.1 MAG: hypothetical protein A3K19_14880 [Lentisphaerae bacterium RIFOXYB12_FULL_65_16]